MNNSTSKILSKQQILEKISHIFLDVLPFNTLFYYRLGTLTDNSAELVFDRRDEFIGNRMQNILHGGVISSALDTVGGFIAARSLFSTHQNAPSKSSPDDFQNLGL